MPVAQVLMAVGSWSLNLSPTTPRTLVDVLSSGYFGHVAIATGRHDPRVEGDSLFSSARYVGVLTGGTFNSAVTGNGPQLSGDGMATWLATPSSVGDVIETPLSFTAATFATVINALLPTAVHAGTIHSIGAATYTGAFVWIDRRKALTTLCGLMSTGAAASQTVEWRANNDGTLDAGHVSDLYVTTPTTAIVARNSGVDMTVRGLPGVTQLIEDVKDYTTRVVVLASGSGSATAVGAANITDVGGTNPYVDRWGNPVKMTRMVSASSVSSFNATAAAQTAILPYTLPRDQVKLTSQEYDIDGVLHVGDYTYVYDPDSGIVDTTQEVVFRGQRINPVLLRVIELDWPVTQGMTVAYRDKNGVWYDLTDYMIWDTGDTTVVVGGYNRALVSTSEPVGPRPIPDTTIPGVPVFGAFTTTSYQGASDGKTKAQIQVQWATPTNTDGTTITDGDHYEIQYRPDLGVFATNPSYNQLQSAGYTYNSLAALGGTYNQLIPQTVANWKVTFVAWGTNNLLIQELTPGVNYDFQIRAVDTAQPPNHGGWSATTTFQAAVDSVPPATPDAPTVAAGLAAVQITWDCGSATGGTFNQAVDLHHIEVHGSIDPLFTPSNSTKLGNVIANIGNVTGQIPVVATMQLPVGSPPAQSLYIKIIAVDVTGNKSQPSAAAGATAALWSDAYISDLSVSKVTAGTITATWIIGGTIATASSGVRVVMDSTGFHAYDSGGNQTFNVSAATGQVNVSSSGSGQRVALATGVDLSGYIGFAQTADSLLFYSSSITSPSVVSGFNDGEDTLFFSTAPASYTGSFGVASKFSAVQQMSSGPNASFSLGIYDANSGVYNGGQLSMIDAPASVTLGVYNEGSSVGYFNVQMLTSVSTTDPQLEMAGYFNNWATRSFSAFDAFLTGDIGGIAAATTSLTWTFGPTMKRNTMVVAQSLCLSAGVQASKIGTLPNTTNFNLTLGGAYTGLWSIEFMGAGIR